jgi:hypothetical protein
MRLAAAPSRDYTSHEVPTITFLGAWPTLFLLVADTVTQQQRDDGQTVCVVRTRDGCMQIRIGTAWHGTRTRDTGQGTGDSAAASIACRPHRLRLHACAPTAPSRITAGSFGTWRHGTKHWGTVEPRAPTAGLDSGRWGTSQAPPFP